MTHNEAEIVKVIALLFSNWLVWYNVRKYDSYPKISIPSNIDSFQLALEFGISVMVIACLCALGPFSWGPTVGGEGACIKVSLPNVEVSETNDKKGQTALHMDAKGHNYEVGEHDFAYCNNLLF
nr:probable copper-transporting ATPase HMA5 [Tanacetum cinerariifolium]